ncbi:MAG: hypothetical protein ACQESP_09395 [Candidatus Muiribacteriota bacterium]
MGKVAFFIDWENFKQDIYAVQKHTGIRVFNFNEPGALIKLFRGFLDPDEKFYRIFFYTSYPFNPRELYKSIIEKRHLNEYTIRKFKKYFQQNEKDLTLFYQENKTFLDNLSYEEYVALRAGTLKVNGLNIDGSPIFVQKQVDMLLGLDIAHVSYRQLVDKVIIFTKDTDITPALKSGRLTGVEALIGNLEGSHKIPDILKKHADVVRTKNIANIFKNSNSVKGGGNKKKTKIKNFKSGSSSKHKFKSKPKKKGKKKSTISDKSNNKQNTSSD